MFYGNSELGVKSFVGEDAFPRHWGFLSENRDKVVNWLERPALGGLNPILVGGGTFAPLVDFFK